MKVDRETGPWNAEELQTFGGASKLKIAPLRRDGTPRRPVPIWVVRVGDDLYVRSWHGPSGGWYRIAQQRHSANVGVGGRELRVALEHIDDELTNDAIDDSYRAKYGQSSYVAEMIRPEARATTLRLLPHASEQVTRLES